MPRRPLRDIDIIRHAAGVPNFRGVFMRDDLPTKPWKNESAVVNLDEKQGSGTHWVAYRKKGQFAEYFDSFGNLKPPCELINYLNCKITYNTTKHQNFGSFNCGHLCLNFLYS